MELPLYQLDAFTDQVFAGNPAAVCPLDSWLDDETLQAIAVENNLSETAYFIRDGENYRLRWFTPATEVDLCGHATLASAQVIMDELEPGRDSVAFETLSGTVTVARGDGGLLEMDFPSRPAKPASAPSAMLAALGRAPGDVRLARDYLLVYGAESDIRSLKPDFSALAAAIDVPGGGVIVTAPAAEGADHDFVSRFFAPHLGIDEDPATGSAHCTSVPYWAERLGKSDLVARQISARGATLYCTDAGERVMIRGHCRLYMRGTILI